MTTQQIVTAIAIHLFTPLAGLVLFAWLCIRMRKVSIPKPPIVPMFFLFAFSGGWLLVLLTGFFWQWSGMASLGVFFLLMAAPFITLGMARSLQTSCNLSPFHRWAFGLSATYSGIMFVLFVIWVTVWLVSENR